jgi:UDP-glucose 4-epimerase
VVTEKVVRLFGEGEELRDHLYVDDLVRLTSSLAGSALQGCFNLATGTSRTFASIVEDLRRIIPHGFSVVKVPRRVPVAHRQFDVSRLVGAVPGFRFTEFTTGLRATFAAVST